MHWLVSNPARMNKRRPSERTAPWRAKYSRRRCEFCQDATGVFKDSYLGNGLCYPLPISTMPLNTINLF